jgi:hypothetical protein
MSKYALQAERQMESARQNLLAITDAFNDLQIAHRKTENINNEALHVNCTIQGFAINALSYAFKSMQGNINEFVEYDDVVKFLQEAIASSVSYTDS